MLWSFILRQMFLILNDNLFFFKDILCDVCSFASRECGIQKGKLSLLKFFKKSTFTLKDASNSNVQ